MRILLGVRLRRLREASRVSLEEAGYVIRASPSKISRLETGRVGCKDRDIVGEPDPLIVGRVNLSD